MGEGEAVRLTFTLACVLWCVPALAAGQETQSSSETSAPMLGPIGLPLPSIGLPLPRIGLPPMPERRTGPERSEAPTVPPRRGPRAPRPSVIYVVSPHPWWTPPTHVPAAHAAVPDTPAAPATGRLHLEVEPAGLPQLFVDGAYVGTLDDLHHQIDLAPGIRQIELRAAGFETLTLDVHMAAGRDITYRGALEERQAPASAPPSESDAPVDVDPVVVITGSRTMYEIPGCYMGNVPPDEVPLPAGCDPARVRVFTP